MTQTELQQSKDSTKDLRASKVCGNQESTVYLDFILAIKILSICDVVHFKSTGVIYNPYGNSMALTNEITLLILLQLRCKTSYNVPSISFADDASKGHWHPSFISVPSVSIVEI